MFQPLNDEGLIILGDCRDDDGEGASPACFIVDIKRDHCVEGFQLQDAEQEHFARKI